jgi:hypothetical protein
MGRFRNAQWAQHVGCCPASRAVPVHFRTDTILARARLWGNSRLVGGSFLFWGSGPLFIPCPGVTIPAGSPNHLSQFQRAQSMLVVIGHVIDVSAYGIAPHQASIVGLQQFGRRPLSFIPGLSQSTARPPPATNPTVPKQAPQCPKLDSFPFSKNGTILKTLRLLQKKREIDAQIRCEGFSCHHR